jgi:hypothetical protein
MGLFTALILKVSESTKKRILGVLKISNLKSPLFWYISSPVKRRLLDYLIS